MSKKNKPVKKFNMFYNKCSSLYCLADQYHTVVFSSAGYSLAKLMATTLQSAGYDVTICDVYVPEEDSEEVAALE